MARLGLVGLSLVAGFDDARVLPGFKEIQAFFHQQLVQAAAGANVESTPTVSEKISVDEEEDDMQVEAAFGAMLPEASSKEKMAQFQEAIQAADKGDRSLWEAYVKAHKEEHKSPAAKKQCTQRRG